MRYKKLFIAFAFAFAPALFSCALSTFDETSSSPAEEESTVCEKSGLFVADESSGQYVLETNDTKYISSSGCTLWTAPFENESDGFSTYSVTACKESGRSEAGFGIVFCSQEIDSAPYMLTVLINTAGLYAIGKVSDGLFSHISSGWKSSSYINKGYGIKNVLAVSYDEGDKEFMLEINGYSITTFTTSEKISFKGSKAGFVAVIAANENFPDTSVKVTFENNL